MSEERWFGATSLYRWTTDGKGGPADYVYEERVVFIRAHNADQAIARGEEEATRYAAEHEGIEYLGAIDTFDMFDEVGDGAEVYSLV